MKTSSIILTIKTLREDIEIHRKHSTGVDVSNDNAKFIELGGCYYSIPGYSTHCDNYMSPTIN